jgi:hypothetical protein
VLQLTYGPVGLSEIDISSLITLKKYEIDHTNLKIMKLRSICVPDLCAACILAHSKNIQYETLRIAESIVSISCLQNVHTGESTRHQTLNLVYIHSGL